MLFISSFTHFKDYILLPEPINFGKYSAVGYFPYSAASVNNMHPKVSRTVFEHIEKKLRSIMDNKIVVVFKDNEHFGTDDFILQFHDAGCRMGKLEDITGYGGRELKLIP